MFSPITILKFLFLFLIDIIDNIISRDQNSHHGHDFVAQKFKLFTGKINTKLAKTLMKIN